MSHLGRPKGDPKKDAPFKMDRVADRLGELLGRPVQKVDEVVGPTATAAAQALKPGEVLVLENLRFHPGEQAERRGVRHASWPPSATSTSTTPSAPATARTPRCCAVPAAMKGKPRVVGLLVAKELDILDQLLSQSAAAAASASWAAARCRTRSASSRACLAASIRC